MTGETLFVFLLLAATIVLFASELLRLDVVAVMVVLVLMLSQVLSPTEALGGFGDPLVLLIAGLFVVGEGLFRTGVAFRISTWVTTMAGTSETCLLVMLMLVVAGLSAFMSSTGTVAIFIPVVINLAGKVKSSPAKLLIPISIASLIGGMLTLIGTPPNLVVSTELSRNNLAPFTFFAFTPIGLLILIVGIAYLVVVGGKLLPKDTGEKEEEHTRLTLRDLADAYELTDQLHYLRIEANSPLANQTLAQAKVRTRFEVNIVGLERQGQIMPVLPQTELLRGDRFFVVGPVEQVKKFSRSENLHPLTLGEKQKKLVPQELGLAEVLLSPRSKLIGSTLGEIRFRERYGLTVLGILRLGQPIKDNLINIVLAFGDSLLVGGGWRQIDLLQSERNDFLVLTIPQEMSEVAPERAKAPWALAIVGGMLALMTFNLVPSVAAVLLAALAMVLAGCLTMKDAYNSINWQSLVLIAGMLPMAQAMDKTGGVKLIVNQVAVLGDIGPLALMVGLFVITSFLSQVISNTATAVLVAPIALGSAKILGVSPYPLLMTVAIAASTAFATPVASPVNTLVLGPGGYRFNDFLKVGLPLIVLSMIVTLLAVPVIFPLK
jgi:di/tricarboxylate transporter